MSRDCGIILPMPALSPASAARVLSAHGRLAWILSPDRGAQLAGLKGRSLQVFANDQVRVDFSPSPPIIVEVMSRRNRLYREEGPRAKTLAANVDGVLILLSGHPGFSPDITLRVMSSLINQSIPFTLVLNKWDRLEDRPTTQRLLRSIQPIRPELHWPCVETSCRLAGGLGGLLEHLQTWPAGGSRSIALAGQSGMGKSSLLNALVPDADAQTQAISEALQSGRHTTTASRVYAWGADWIIDTPGFQRFGITHIEAEDLLSVFPEWGEIAPEGCRYLNCRHDHEPSCRVRWACEQDARLEERRQAWLRLLSGAGG